MTIIHTVISQAEVKRLSQRDNTYLKHKLEANCMLNTILQRPINRPLLAELQYVLDRQPIARQKIEQYRRNSEVRVYNLAGVMIRVEYCNGKIMKRIET